jgi:hypothetical protein
MRVAWTCCSVACLVWLLGQPADARTIKVSSVAGWRISAETEPNSATFGFCKAVNALRGAAMTFALTRDFKWESSIEFSGWTLVPDRRFEIFLALDPESDGPIYKLGATATGERQITVNLATKLSDDNELFVAIRKLHVLTIVIDDQVSPKLEFQLTGTSEALPALLRCVAQFGKAATSPSSRSAASQ